MLNPKCRWILAGAFGAFVAAIPAHASLIADGITYTLTETLLTATTAQFDLHISGINAPLPGGDLEGGRFGVNAFAFTRPANFSGATPPSGFSFMEGGQNSKGCNGSGNFFCFADIPPTPFSLLPANSTLDFVFNVTISAGSFAGYVPDFKIDWVGTKNNYDLVSQPLTPVPAPVIGHGLFVLLAVGGVLYGGKLLENLKKHRLLQAV